MASELQYVNSSIYVCQLTDHSGTSSILEISFWYIFVGVSTLLCEISFQVVSYAKAGKCINRGDCAHPMLPYMAQGANSSLEDGATIGGLLSKVRRRDQISDAMEMYDSIRRPRVDQLVQETFKLGKEHHLPDGPEQVKRDQFLSRSFEPPTQGTHGTGTTWYFVLFCHKQLHWADM